MDEDISIINTETRNEKIKNFLIKKKNLLISVILSFILIIISFYSFQIYKERSIEDLSEKFNSAVIEFNNKKKSKTIKVMREIIDEKNSTYSPLALYFLIDNNLAENAKEVNQLFDILINETSLEKEIKYLIIYKKGLYNADFVNENDLLNILKPLINSESVWKSHALYLIAEFFYSIGEKQKSKEFFNEIINLKNSNENLKLQAQKRINRDLSD